MRVVKRWSTTHRGTSGEEVVRRTSIGPFVNIRKSELVRLIDRDEGSDNVKDQDKH